MTAIDWDKLAAAASAFSGDNGTAPAVPEHAAPLEFSTLAELRARVTAAGPRRWMLRGIWPAGDYGIHSAEQKAQKTWTVVDLVVSVASHTAWLGSVPVDDPGPVLMFHGEGSEANILRRIDAVCASRGVDPDTLEIVICTRAPKLANQAHLDIMQEEIAAAHPRLVTLDPLYLAARGGKLGDLLDMGALLEGAQHVCQGAGASLFVAHHHNRQDGRGMRRISGAGAAEWGRVLITGDVISRHTNPVTHETTVVTELDVIGGEVHGGAWRVTRRIRAVDPDDLDSPLAYAVEAQPAEHGDDEMPPAKRKLLEALIAAKGVPQTSAALVDWIVNKHGHGLRRETCSRELNALMRDGIADRIDPSPGLPALWVTAELVTDEGRSNP